MVGSKMISVRLNLEVARELEKFQSGSLLSKNMIINRGTRLYIQLLQELQKFGEGPVDLLELSNQKGFIDILGTLIANQRVYWRL